MMRFKGKNVSGFTLIELIIVIAIIAILSAIIIPSIGRFTRDRQVIHANQNAKLVFMQLQKEVNRLVYTDSTDTVTSASGTYDNMTGDFIEKIDNGGTGISLHFEIALPQETRKSTWYAGIDNATKTVKYVVWIQDYNVTTTTISGITTLSQQNSHNNSVTSTEKIVGLYPTGT